jgi:hypothetical protein
MVNVNKVNAIVLCFGMDKIVLNFKIKLFNVLIIVVNMDYV